MPHLVLEISNNVLERPRPEFFKELHEVALSNAPFELKDLKSRLIVHEHYYIGDGSAANAFVHLGVSMLAGRDLATRKQLSKALHEYLTSTFKGSISSLNCRLTVEVREIDRESHSKSA